MDGIEANKLDKSEASSTYGAYEMAEAHGAAASYNSGVDDTAFVNAAIAAAIASGRELRLSRVYSIPAGGLTASAPIKISGIGGRFTSANQGGTFPGIAPSGFRCSSTTADCLTTNAAAPILTDFAIINTAVTAPTAGTGLTINAGYNHAVTRVTVAGFYNDIKIDGRFGTIDSCHFYDPVNYGMWFKDLLVPGDAGDFGDQGITNCVIAMYGRTTDAEAAVRWDSGGGIRWNGNKIVAGTGPDASGIGNFRYGLDIMAEDGCTSGEFMVIGGGVSTCSTACVRIGAVGAGGLGSLTFSGVVFQGAGLTAKAFLIGASDVAHGNSVRDINIACCSFKGVPTGGIVAYNCRGLHIGTNTWGYAEYTGPLITLAGGTDTGIGTQDVTIAQQNLEANDYGVDVILDLRHPGTSPHPITGTIDYSFSTSMMANVVGTWVTAGYVDATTTGGGFVLDVEFTGIDYGAWTAIYAHYRRVLTSDGTGGADLTIATLGTDETAGTGAHYAVRFDTTTTPNRVAVQYQLLTGGGVIWGKVAVKASGMVGRWHVGP